jgi:hypothetical protein
MIKNRKSKTIKTKKPQKMYSRKRGLQSSRMRMLYLKRIILESWSLLFVDGV